MYTFTSPIRVCVHMVIFKCWQLLHLTCPFFFLYATHLGKVIKMLRCFLLWWWAGLKPSKDCLLAGPFTGIPHAEHNEKLTQSPFLTLSRNFEASLVFLGFPCSSAGRESACNVGNLGSIPGLGRSPGEGKGYPLQCLAWRIHGVARSRTWLSDFHFHST